MINNDHTNEVHQTSSNPNKGDDDKIAHPLTSFEDLEETIEVFPEVVDDLNNSESREKSAGTLKKVVYDLTTIEGREQAIEVLKEVRKKVANTSSSASNIANVSLSFLSASLKTSLDAFQNTVNSLTKLVSINEEIDKQKEAAIEIIKAGAENDTEEIEITLSEKAGFAISSQLEYPVEIIAGKRGEMTVKVKYKSNNDLPG